MFALNADEMGENMSDKDIKNKKTVAVGMSGGVDSSVAAALLLSQGYEVIGATMAIEEGMPKAVDDARAVAQALGIPHYIFNFRNIFKEKVVGYFVAEYLRGKTPNPCVACNRYVKFGVFFDEAKRLGADYIATGHYARTEYNEETGKYQLLRAKDLSKDQSYVLYNLKQDQLSRTLFPLGSYTKAMIREKAETLGLAVAQKAESQEICFIPDHDYKGFLEQYKGNTEKIKPGHFLNTRGEVIGKHQGLSHYTVGQRKGLGLALGYPAYVVAIDAENNNVIIGREEEIFQKELIAIDNSFITFEQLTQPTEVEAKIRYSAVPAKAVITPEGKNVRVVFSEPQRAVTPGQSVVFYRGDEVIGGGIIDTVMHSQA